MAISVDKYDPVARAILAVLSTEPIKFGRLVDLVARRPPRFEGSVAWYTISVASAAAGRTQQIVSWLRIWTT